MRGIRNFTSRRSEDLRVLEDASFVGELRPICFTITGAGVVEIAPGWLYCNGAAISRATYKRLFDRIGTLYGVGDGSTTFNLPDFRGRSPLPHADGQTGATRVANAGAIGNANAPGGVGGADVVALDAPKLPAHQHDKGTLAITGGGSGSHGLGTLAVLGATTGSGNGVLSNNGGAITVNIPVTVSFSAATHAHAAGDFAGLFENGTVAGIPAGSPTHNNIPPTVPVPGLVIRT